MTLTLPALVTVVTTLLFLLTSGTEVDALALHTNVDPLHWQRHRRFYPPRSPDGLTGYGMRYIQKPHINPVSFRQPHLSYDRMTHVEGPHGFRHQQSVADHLHGGPPTGWGLLKSAISRRIDDILDQSGVSRTLFYSSVGSWYSAFETTLKRDAIYNIGKVGGILVLYYFFPGALAWIHNTFGGI